METETEHLHHLSFHVTDLEDWARVVGAFSEDLDRGHKNFLDFSSDKNCSYSDQLQVFWPIQTGHDFEELVSERQSHVKGGLLEA